VIRRAADRFETAFDGVRSWHCFSAGAHYDPDHVAHGAVIGLDEHLVAPGSGFDWHRHRGVTIISYVVSGRLRHEDDDGRVHVVGAGEVLVQRTGAGIRHCEVNASARDSLRLVQTTLLAGGDQSSVSRTALPVDLGEARFEGWRGDGRLHARRWHAFVAHGEWSMDGTALGVGDSVRGEGELSVTGAGTVLVVSEQ
jgi:mannose-6-phosphate isomerase-like protein (cupin superfamily)